MKWERESEGCVFIPNVWRSASPKGKKKGHPEEEPSKQQGGGGGGDPSQVWDRLYSKGKEGMRKKKEAIKAHKEPDDFDPNQCTFRPALTSPR